MLSFTPSLPSLRLCRSLFLSRSTGASSQYHVKRLSSLCIHNLNQRRRKSRRQHTCRRWASTDMVAASATPSNPKISGIVDQISQLTLLETADLVASLKSRLNIPEMSFATPGAASGSSSAGLAKGDVEEEEEAAPAPAAQTVFTLKLESFEATAKPKVIKEVKSILNLSLVESKKFVESAPKVLKEGLPKEEAEKMSKVFEGLGAKVKME